MAHLIEYSLKISEYEHLVDEVNSILESPLYTQAVSGNKFSADYEESMTETIQLNSSKVEDIKAELEGLLTINGELPGLLRNAVNPQIHWYRLPARPPRKWKQPTR